MGLFGRVAKKGIEGGESLFSRLAKRGVKTSDDYVSTTSKAGSKINNIASGGRRYGFSGAQSAKRSGSFSGKVIKGTAAVAVPSVGALALYNYGADVFAKDSGLRKADQLLDIAERENALRSSLGDSYPMSSGGFGDALPITAAASGEDGAINPFVALLGVGVVGAGIILITRKKKHGKKK